jgi:SAM-dependent methyltransferase
MYVRRQDRKERVRIHPPAALRSLVPSPYVRDCLKHLPRQSNGLAGDFGTGYGRHAHLLSSLGYTVLAFDLDPRALQTLRTRIGRKTKCQAQGHIYPVVADVNADLPLMAGQLDLVVAVHCSIHDNLSAIVTAIAPGGFLIYETFGGHGMNWLDLPKASHLKQKLASRFKLLVLQERPVGPTKERAVAVRLLAQKR